MGTTPANGIMDLPSRHWVQEAVEKLKNILQSMGVVSYNSLAYLENRHGLAPELDQNIAAVETLARKAGE